MISLFLSLQAYTSLKKPSNRCRDGTSADQTCYRWSHLRIAYQFLVSIIYLNYFRILYYNANGKARYHLKRKKITNRFVKVICFVSVSLHIELFVSYKKLCQLVGRRSVTYVTELQLSSCANLFTEIKLQSSKNGRTGHSKLTDFNGKHRNLSC